MVLKHYFSKEPASTSLFDGVNCFNEFKNRLTHLSKTLPVENPKRWDRSLDSSNNEKAIRGAGFELFCELFVDCLGLHRHIGLTDYTPTESGEDFGIDAFAKNIEGKRSSIQCKYIGDPTHELTTGNSNIANFVQASFEVGILQAGEPSGALRAFIFTTCRGVNYKILGEDMWNNKVGVFNLAFIKSQVDNNIIFWEKCLEVLRGGL